MQATLFTFRRCPFAIRARLALAVSLQQYTPIEVVLRNKPAALLAASPKGTVPVLVLPNGQVIEQSLDIMRWALAQNDPQKWLQPEQGDLDDVYALIEDLDTHFKPLLDRCKYPERHPNTPLESSRQLAVAWLEQLEARLGKFPFLYGQHICLADAAIFPFVRQFAAVDEDWWNTLQLPALQAWRLQWLQSSLFQAVMQKPT